MNSKETIYTKQGKPFIAIAGEVHNSSASSSAYMEAVWEKAKTLGMNTLLLPASWEIIEPVEGTFVFTLIDELIAQARERGMNIIFLWFGSWKNAQCMYAPEWVKKDLVRFPRAQVEKGKNKTILKKFYGMPYTTLSYLGEETCRADARAFAEFMKHLRNVDEKEHTVIGVQVENETGLQGNVREQSEQADELFAGQVPQKFADYMKAHTDSMEPEIQKAVEEGSSKGSWSEIFGDAAEEIFSAYYIAGYVEKVAAAGKAEYDLPMTVNCWLDKGEEPGVYPSGGPVAKMMEVWQYAAPSIDAFAPDIYVPNFHQICDTYRKNGNPLIIPETAIHAYAAPRLVYCIGHHHAACFSPFGFEEMGQPFNAEQGFLYGMDVTDPLLRIPQKLDEYAWCCKNLNGMMELLISKYGTDDLQAVISEKVDMTPPDLSAGLENLMNGTGENDTMLFGTLGFKVLMNLPSNPRKDGVCLILKEDEETYYILGNGCDLFVFSRDPQKPDYDIILLEEGRFEEGKWKAGRRLNGDEALSLSLKEYSLLKLKVFCY